MRIQILGTAAAEGWPAVFCDCDTCRKVRSIGGKDIRSRASLQIDDIFKIDLPPDTHYHSIRHGIRLSQLKHLFFTHSHDDHFAPRELIYLAKPFAHNLANAPIRIYGNDAVLDVLRETYPPDRLPIELIPAGPYEPIEADSLTFTPIPAEHKKDEQCLNYIVQSETMTVLYASDTGFYADETFAHLADYKFDLIISECTQGLLGHPSIGHMGFEAVLETRDRLAKSGAAAPDVRTVITHFSHNIGIFHADLERAASPHGVEVAYDGVVYEI